MNLITGMLLYLLAARLAIVSAGIVSMVIGYRLLCRGVGMADQIKQDSTIESSFAGLKFSMKNAAPGTAFALFGAVLISVMLVQSSPSVTWESIRKWQATTGSQTSNGTTESTRLQMRGDQGAESITSLTALGRELESHGKTADAERAYQQAVTAMAEPMNDLAWLYLSSGRAKGALGLATLAVQLNPGEARYTDTLAKARAAAK
jgi:hypothetical protein